MKLGQLCRMVPNLKPSKSEMAQRILKQAADGVRDPVRLRASALVRAVASEALKPDSTMPDLKCREWDRRAKAECA